MAASTTTTILTIAIEDLTATLVQTKVTDEATKKTTNEHKACFKYDDGNEVSVELPALAKGAKAIVGWTCYLNKVRKVSGNELGALIAKGYAMTQSLEGTRKKPECDASEDGATWQEALNAHKAKITDTGSAASTIKVAGTFN